MPTVAVVVREGCVPIVVVAVCDKERLDPGQRPGGYAEEYVAPPWFEKTVPLPLRSARKLTGRRGERSNRVPGIAGRERVGGENVALQ